MPKLDVNPKDFDTRMIEWNLKLNKITKEQLASHLKGLPDDAANTENVVLDDEEPSEV